MTPRRRGIFIGLLLGFLATVSLAVVVAAYIQRLPDPSTASRRGLFRWLVERDLAEQPRNVQLVIMGRVEKELLAGTDFSKVAAMLDDVQRQRLLANADLLARCWFEREADRYFAEPESRRSALLGQQITEIQRLGIMDQLAALEHWSSHSGSHPAQSAGIASTRDASATKGSLASLAAQAQRVDQWLAEAPGKIAAE